MGSAAGLWGSTQGGWQRHEHGTPSAMGPGRPHRRQTTHKSVGGGGGRGGVAGALTWMLPKEQGPLGAQLARRDNRRLQDACRGSRGGSRASNTRGREGGGRWWTWGASMGINTGHRYITWWREG